MEKLYSSKTCLKKAGGGMHPPLDPPLKVCSYFWPLALSASPNVMYFVRTVTYGRECWIMKEKARSRVQAAEMGFMRRISGLTLLDKVKSAYTRESLNIEALLLRLERSQLRWYGHVTRMSQKRTAKKLLCSTPIGRRPRGRPRTRWRDYVEDLSWSRPGIPAEHLSFVAEDRDAWRIQLELLPPRPPKDKLVQKID